MACGTQARHTLAVGEDLQRCVQPACNSFGVWISLSQLWQLASAVLCPAFKDLGHTKNIITLVFWMCQSLCTGPMPTQSLPHAYPEWQGCLRWSFPRLGAFESASAGVLCWTAMHLVNDGNLPNATLPAQQKSTLLPCAPTHACADCKISGQHPTQLHKDFPQIHDIGHSRKR